MKISPKTAELVRSDLVLRADRAPKTKGGAAAGKAEATADRVQISDAGRTLAGEGARRLTPERIAEIRGRIQSGAYDSLAVVDRIATRILENGDA